MKGYTGFALLLGFWLTLLLTVGSPARAAPFLQADPVRQCAEGVELFFADEADAALPLLEAGFANRDNASFFLPRDLGRCTLALGFLRHNGGDRSGALDAYSVALEMFQQSREKWLEGLTLNNIGEIYYELGQLLEALADSGSGIRALAANALGELADPRAEASLLQALQDSVAEVRRNAAVALATACSPSFRPVAETIKIIVTGQPEARQTAVRQLVAYEDQRVKDLLIWVLIHDENVQIRTDVARALPQLGVESIELLIQSLNAPHPDRASEVLVALGSDAVAALVAAANEHKGAIQQAAIKTLGQIEDDRVENILVEMLQDADSEPAVKSAAFDALGEIARKPQLLPVVMQMIGNDQFNVRLQKTAVLQLGHTNDPMAAAALVDALDNWSLRHTARDALRQLGDVATDALLARYELEKSKELRRMIGDLLGDKKPAGMKGRLFGRKKK